MGGMASQKGLFFVILFKLLLDFRLRFGDVRKGSDEEHSI